MEYFKEKLPNFKDVEEGIINACKFCGAKYEFVNGNIIKMKKTNVIFIEPHRFIVKYEELLIIVLIYDNENIFLYDRTNPITVSGFAKIFRNILKSKRTISLPQL